MRPAATPARKITRPSLAVTGATPRCSARKVLSIPVVAADAPIVSSEQTKRTATIRLLVMMRIFACNFAWPPLTGSRVNAKTTPITATASPACTTALRQSRSRKIT